MLSQQIIENLSFTIGSTIYSGKEGGKCKELLYEGERFEFAIEGKTNRLRSEYRFKVCIEVEHSTYELLEELHRVVSSCGKLENIRPLMWEYDDVGRLRRLTSAKLKSTKYNQNTMIQHTNIYSTDGEFIPASSWPQSFEGVFLIELTGVYGDGKSFSYSTAIKEVYVTKDNTEHNNKKSRLLQMLNIEPKERLNVPLDGEDIGDMW